MKQTLPGLIKNSTFTNIPRCPDLAEWAPANRRWLALSCPPHTWCLYHISGGLRCLPGTCASVRAWDTDEEVSSRCSTIITIKTHTSIKYMRPQTGSKHQPIVWGEQDERVVDHSCPLQGCEQASYGVVKLQQSISKWASQRLPSCSWTSILGVVRVLPETEFKNCQLAPILFLSIILQLMLLHFLLSHQHQQFHFKVLHFN